MTMTLPTGTFVCVDCEGSFTTVIGRNGDRRLRCEPCRLTRESKMNAENAKRWREKNREYVRENDSARKKLARLTDPEFKARTDERARLWDIAHPERVRARTLRYAAVHAERKAANDKAWDEAHPERVKERQRRYTAAHPDKMRAKNHKRRARVLDAGGAFTPEEFTALCEAHGNRCVYCGSDAKLTVDHNVPLIRGGTNDIANILPACQPCNSRKGARTADEYLAQVAA